MELDDIAVRIADEDENGTVRQFHRLGDGHFMRGQLFANGVEIVDLERNMREPRMFFRQIHEDVFGRSIARRVEDEINVDAGGVQHHGDWFGTDWADDEFEAELFIKRPRFLQAPDPEANMVDARNLLHGDHSKNLENCRDRSRSDQRVTPLSGPGVFPYIILARIAFFLANAFRFHRFQATISQSLRDLRKHSDPLDLE